MRNGLYSLHMHMLDGVKGRDSGVIILRDGKLIGGGPYFWSIGTYTVGDGTWKGEFTTNQHTPLPDRFARPLSGGQEVTSGFSGTFTDDGAEAFGTSLEVEAAETLYRAGPEMLSKIAKLSCKFCQVHFAKLPSSHPLQ